MILLSKWIIIYLICINDMWRGSDVQIITDSVNFYIL